MIVTSATIDAERFSQHFDGRAGDRGRRAALYPVEVRYRPVGGDARGHDPRRGGARSPTRSTSSGASGRGRRAGVPARRARDPRCRRSLRKHAADTRRRDPAAVRAAVGGGAGPRVQAGAARAASCSPPTSPRPRSPCRASATWSTPATRASSATAIATRSSMLRVEPISQAAARPARRAAAAASANGICIRLYAEEDFAQRPRFTDPEILRSSLAARDPAHEEPGPRRGRGLSRSSIRRAPRAIADGYALLAELGAVDEANELTPIGSELAQAAARPARRRACWSAARDEGCLAQVRIIAAALSVQDPRERPLDKAAAADERHATLRARALGLSLTLLKLCATCFDQQDGEACARELPLRPAHARMARRARTSSRARCDELGWPDSSVDAGRSRKATARSIAR